MLGTFNTAIRSVPFCESHSITTTYIHYYKYQHILCLPSTICSLNDRRPVSNEDEVVVLLTPDHQGLPDVERINTTLAGDDDTPVSSLCYLSGFFYCELDIPAVIQMTL